MKAKYTLPLLAVAAIGGFAIAQQQTQQTQQTSQSTSSSQSGQGSSRASSSASGQASSSVRAGGGSTQAGSASSGTMSGKYKITRPTHAVFYTPNPVGGQRTGVRTSETIWEDQKRYFELLGRNGKLLYAGPWHDGNGAMLILNCTSDGEAQNIADEDPVVKGMLFVANVRSWNVTYIGPGVIQPDRTGQQSGN